MKEFVSEMFREYYQDPINMKTKFPAFYDLIEEAIK